MKTHATPRNTITSPAFALAVALAFALAFAPLPGILALPTASSAAAASSAPGVARPLGQHCYDFGPLPDDPDFCGCTWGAVLVDGQPVTGAQVTLTFAGKTVSAQSKPGAAEPFPFYALSGADAGAKYGDVVTLTARYGDRTVTRVIRLLPGAGGEQQAALIFPAEGHWERWTDEPGVYALAADGDTLWVGAAGGLTRWRIAARAAEPLPAFPWGAVKAVAVGPDGSVWAGGPGGLARLSGGVWAPQATGLASANISAVAVAADGAVWAGANHPSAGGVSRFDGRAWLPQADFNGALPNTVRGLALDARGHLWVGTEDAGASRWDGSAWQRFTVDDGLASDAVYGVTAHGRDVWFGTFAYDDGTARRGGAARYNIDTGAWSRYTAAQGLAGDDVTAVAVDRGGRPWFGVWGGGVSRYDGVNWWTFTEGAALGSNRVRSLAVGADGSVWVGGERGVDRFRPGAGGAAPQLTAASARQTGLGAGRRFEFAATAADAGEVAAYEWRSDRDGWLGSEAAFTVRGAGLSRGAHTITVRAADEAGNWSAPASVALVVTEPVLWLPLVGQ
jgi:hypothetical protein